MTSNPPIFPLSDLHNNVLKDTTEQTNDTTKKQLPSSNMLVRIYLLALVSTALLSATAQAEPAVVNPAVRTPLQEVISLRGEWTFAKDPNGIGRNEGWMHPGAVWPETRTIQVPGCWEAQGVGDPGISQPWDMKDRAPYPLRHVYMGTAWYRRNATIPPTWKDKRVWLKIGGVRSQGWFWVNGKPVAHDYAYCGVYKYDITDCIVPGQDVSIVACVRNDVPSRKGLASWRHRAGGLIRDVELEATPDMHISNAWVQGDFDKREAIVHTTVAYISKAERLKNPVLRVAISPWHDKRSASGKQAGSNESSVVFTEGSRKTEVNIRVRLDPFRPWSPQHPNLYVAEISLCDGDTPVHRWTERFGVRKLEVRGNRFFLNNKPFFARGYGDDHIYPIKLTSPASKDEHLHRLRIARAAGFNYVRLHTHCELPEFFEAADEAGMLVQAELPYNHAKPGEAFPSDPKRDLTELITHYQRYVSLATCCMGNEGGFTSPLDTELYKLSKHLNPSLLVLHHDGGKNTRANSDFRSGPIRPWTPAKSPAPNDVPYIAHEYLNLSVKADPRLAYRFTGAYLASLTSLDLDKEGFRKVQAQFPPHMSDADSAPRDMKSIEAELKILQLGPEWGSACQDSAHAIQRYYQKQGIEAARRDPTCDGYSFWTIVDVLYQAQGLFNVFWEAKSGGATAEDFRIMNGPTVILIEDSGHSPIAVSGEILTHSLWISHFGEAHLKDTRVKWTLQTGKKTLASGNFKAGDIAVGEVRELGPCTFTIPPLKQPVHAILEATLTGGESPVKNQWNLWLFPERMPEEASGIAATRQIYPVLVSRFPGLTLAGTPEGDAAKVLIAAEGDPDALTAIESGRRVVLLDRCKAPGNSKLGWWLLSNQTGTAMAHHPVYGNFPHDGLMSPLWFRIVKRPELLQPDNGFCGAEPLMVGEGIHGYSLYLCQARVGESRLIRSCGLDMLTDTPEGNYLLDSMLAYAQSEDFAPQASLDPATLSAWWQRTQKGFDALNGWGESLNNTGHRVDHYFFGTARSNMTRGGKKHLEWKTLPPVTSDSGSSVTYRWLQETRLDVWGPKATAPVSLSLNGKRCLTYTADILRRKWTERKNNTSLSYYGLDFTQNSMTGLMELTVPRSWVDADTSSVIKLECGNTRLSTGVVEINSTTFSSGYNGWLRTIEAGDRVNIKFTPKIRQLNVARALKGNNTLAWETYPAPADIRTKKEYEIVWLGGMGYFSEPQGSFTLFVNDEKVIDIQEISQRDTEWQNNDGTVQLSYMRDLSTAEYGILTLTLPSSKVIPGKPLRLKLVGSESNSRRWMGVFETW